MHDIRACRGQRDVLGGPSQHGGAGKLPGGPDGNAAKHRIGLYSHNGGRFRGVTGQPVTGATAEVDERLPGPWRDRAHRGQHVAGLIDGTILKLVGLPMRADVGREPEVGERGHSGHGPLSKIPVSDVEVGHARFVAISRGCQRAPAATSRRTAR